MMIFLDTSKQRKKYFRGTVVALSASIIFCIIFFASHLLFNKSIEPPPIKYARTVDAYHYYYSVANKKKIALTFDDGPRPGITVELMNILERNNTPAMFFFIGQDMLLQPDVVYEAAQKGFSIGNHSFTHRESVHDSQNRLALELRSTGYLISKITGSTPLFYRPPFLLGIGVDPTVNPYLPIPKDILWTLEDGVIPTGADIDARDWLATSSASVVERFRSALEAAPNGHIVLLHEEQHTVEALQQIIGLIKNKGYSIVSLEELLTPPSEISLSKNLVLGSIDKTSGGEVFNLQWFLFQQGDLDPYLLTGTFDAETRDALIRFQLRNHLINPNNIDPARAGITDPLTQNTIHTLSLATNNLNYPAITKAPTSRGIVGWIGNLIRVSYINLIPSVRASLIVMVKIALYLVIIRLGFIALIFAIGTYQKKRSSVKLISKDKKKHRGVSILIPAYNEEENIRATIESVLRCAHSRKEIIVIDDGSTDGTAKVVESMIITHPHQSIKLLQVKNGGKAWALNHGMKLGRFDICVVIDADAVLDQNSLYYFTRHFADPSVAAVAGRVETTGRKGFLNLFQMLEYAMGQNIDKRVLSTLGAVGVVPGPAGAWHKTFVQSVGGFSSETLVEDQDMTLTLLRMGKKVIYEKKAVAYTETPHTINNFLKQRFRWIYGTTQCFWKHKKIFLERPLSVMSLVVMPNIFIFNILLPLSYPFADSAFLVGLIFGEWQSMVFPFILFTLFDLLYATIGTWGETNFFRLLGAVPLQRVVYRQLLYYTVARSIVRAVEGTGAGWNKFAKTGETQRFYFSSLKTNCPSHVVDVVGISFETQKLYVSRANQPDLT